MPSPPDLERLYDAHASALVAFGRQFTRDDGEVLDLVQEVFVKLARHPELLDGIHNERAFVLRLFRNAYFDILRRRKIRRADPEAPPRPAPEPFAAAPDPDQQAFRTALAASLRELPEDQREVVHLKLWEGLTFDAIAGILDIPLNTAASRYRYGLDKLRQHLRPLYEELR